MHRKLSALTFALWGALFIVAHQPNGPEIYINADQIQYIAPSSARAGDEPRAGAHVIVFGTYIQTRETPAELKDAIDRALKQAIEK
jgi:hypothetical protein